MSIAKAKQAEVSACDMADDALSALSCKARVNYALRVILGTTDPDAVGAVLFAASRLKEHAELLIREAYDRGSA